jgi:hypothetical protein
MVCFPGLWVLNARFFGGRVHNQDLFPVREMGGLSPVFRLLRSIQS